MLSRRSVAVIGLGHVGLTTAVAFARAGVRVIGFDVDNERMHELRRGYDRMADIDTAELNSLKLDFLSDSAALVEADFYVVAVPTHVDPAGHPDLSELLSASALIGPTLRSGDIVVHVSTVYPGAIEELCIPTLERSSQFAAGTDFSVGYSPERADFGDKSHTLQNVRRVVAGQDAATRDVIADVFAAIVAAGIHKAPSIRVAETAKIIENAQRYLNIALVNELSRICNLVGIDTVDVLEAAATKWNFMAVTPGLVGGECLELATRYLEHSPKADRGRSELLLAARRSNDAVVKRIVSACTDLLRQRGIQQGLITVLGITYKENVRDIRKSKVLDLIVELRAARHDIQVHDPVADAKAARNCGISITARTMLKPADIVILAVPHREFVASGRSLVLSLLKQGGGIVIDIKSRLNRSAVPPSIQFWRL